MGNLQQGQAGRPNTRSTVINSQGKDRCAAISNDDHPEFAKLREQLGQDGYIKIERSWWNGDRVTKPFTLNGTKFKAGEPFPCGAAMRSHMKFK